MVKCWDLEQNKVIRHYHGHLSGVYSLRSDLPPPLSLRLSADVAGLRDSRVSSHMSSVSIRRLMFL